ncbi:MAG: amidohydrolase [Clostridiales Family XIII bacterium]|jgi:5-methylthioadenosine/S-adenosylhomocysteine deaminase|nr:amidohydrolase [Clostridiales Family XIII bacterium]
MSILFEDIAALTPYGIKEHLFVSVDGARIAYVGGSRPQGSFARVFDGRERLLMPGFYNAHAHSPMSLMRGYGENMTLSDWLTKRIFPFEEALTGEDVYWATMLSMAESFRYGVVSSTDMYFFCEDMIRAVVESGAKANVGRGIASDPGEEDITTLESFKEAVRLYENHHGAAEGRVRVDMALHAEYTSSPAVARGLAEYAGKTGAHTHVHVSETRAEHEACKARRGGLTPVAYFDDLGLFATRATAAHCVWAEESDMDILAARNATVASCPVSNLKLAGGVCNVPALLQKGVNVAIGTDSVASNNNLNMVEEMKFFALLNKERRGDPTCVTPLETLRAATVAGAESQGREDCGRIEGGMKADLIMLDVSAPHMHPVHDMCGNLVYSASGGEVTLTVADGRIVYETGCWPTIDVERAKIESERAVGRILGALHG